MIERRRHPIIPVNEPARLLSPSYAVLGCTIRDLSAVGARLEIDANPILSDMFDLVPKERQPAAASAAVSPFAVPQSCGETGLRPRQCQPRLQADGVFPPAIYEIRRNFQTYGADGLIDRLPCPRAPYPSAPLRGRGGRVHDRARPARSRPTPGPATKPTKQA
jgi:hypothetical protein